MIVRDRFVAVAREQSTAGVPGTRANCPAPNCDAGRLQSRTGLVSTDVDSVSSPMLRSSCSTAGKRSPRFDQRDTDVTYGMPEPIRRFLPDRNSNRADTLERAHDAGSSPEPDRPGTRVTGQCQRRSQAVPPLNSLVDCFDGASRRDLESTRLRRDMRPSRALSAA